MFYFATAGIFISIISGLISISTPAKRADLNFQAALTKKSFISCTHSTALFYNLTNISVSFCNVPAIC
jgi:hypothetical protein